MKKFILFITAALSATLAATITAIIKLKRRRDGYKYITIRSRWDRYPRP